MKRFAIEGARLPLTALLAAALVQTGCSKDDKKWNEQAADKIDEATAKGEAPPLQLKGFGISTDGTEAKIGGAGKTDWTQIEAKGDTPADPKVKPDQVSTEGIPEEMRGFSGVKAVGFRVAYAPSQKYDHFRQAFMQEQVFENVRDMLNQTIKMPRVVDIHLVDCGTVNAFYDPNNNRIIMCYELMDYYTNMFKPVSKTNEELGNAILGATFFAFFHELGHGLRHQLDLPVTGREEDAVDQLATLILMEGGDQGVAAAMAGARWFAMQAEASKEAGHQMPFWDEHSMDAQRFYNISCLIFGSNPDKYEPMVANGYLPGPRARRCATEYRDISKAWERLLEPHLKDPAAGTAETPATPGQPNTAPPSQPQQPNQPGTGPMAPKPLPGTEQPAESALSCEKVVLYAVEVVTKELLTQAQKMGPEAVEQMTANIQANMPLMAQQLVTTCEQQNWPPAARQCVMKSKSMADLDACPIQP